MPRGDPKGNVIRNVDGMVYYTHSEIVEGLVEQLDHAVQFRKSLELCKREGVREFYDFGSIGILQTMIKQNIFDAVIHQFNSVERFEVGDSGKK